MSRLGRNLLLGGVLILTLGACYKEEVPEVPMVEVETYAVEEKVTEPEVFSMEFFFTGDALIHGTVWMDADQGDGTYDFSGILEEVGRLSEGYDLKYYNQETILGGVERKHRRAVPFL